MDASEDIIAILGKRLYDRPVMDNRDRGAYAEQLVGKALSREWRWVGLGWHPWDFQRGKGKTRLRIQIKQSASQQIWTPRKLQTRTFMIPIRKKAPSYFERDNPGEHIESCGHFCELFVFAWHGVHGASCDQRDPYQWDFFVIPERVFHKRSKVPLHELEQDHPVHSWSKLGTVVDLVANNLVGPMPPALSVG